jgi:hypothetical protein
MHIQYNMEALSDLCALVPPQIVTLNDQTSRCCSQLCTHYRILLLLPESPTVFVCGTYFYGYIDFLKFVWHKINSYV